MDPVGIDAWAERGKMLSRLDRIEESLESFDRILALTSDDADAWYNRGLCLTKLGRMQEALEAFQEAGRCGSGGEEESQIGLDLFGFFTKGDESLEALGRLDENIYLNRKYGYRFDREFLWDDGARDRLQVREVSDSTVEVASSRYPQCRLTIEAQARIACNYPAKELASDLATGLCARGGETRFYVFPNGLVPAHALRTASAEGDEIQTDIIVTDRFAYRLIRRASTNDDSKTFTEKITLSFHPQNDL